MARPFARARAMMAAIQAILSTAPSPFDARMLIDGLAPYRSRGHGRGKHSGVRVKAYAKMRAQRNKPIQGKQEIARRLRVLPLESKPRALWRWRGLFDAPTRVEVVRLVKHYYGHKCPAKGIKHG